MLITGGRSLYGLALGIMQLDTRFPRALGDVGNAATWPFPVSYRVVRGAVAERLAQAEPDGELLEPFVRAVRELEEDGVGAIITSCGFLAYFQRELAGAVSIPVFSSALMQVPIAAQSLRGDQCVGIITARAVLTEGHFRGAGWSAPDIRVVQAAPAEDSHFIATFVGDGQQADTDLIDREIAEVTEKLMSDHPDTGAIVLECANLAPFAPTIRRVSGVAVYDLYTLGMFAYLATTGTEFGEGPGR